MKPARYEAGKQLTRHSHRDAYAALVLEGGYVEAGDRGRIVAKAGQVLFHGAFEAHQNTFASTGATVLDLPVARSDLIYGMVPDPDIIACLAENDPKAACELLQATVVVQLQSPVEEDWPARLARDMIDDPNLNLGEWAGEAELTPQSVSRGFRQVFGVTPKKFRAVQRTLQTVRIIPDWKGSGAALAVERGFADQAHMSRSVSALTGNSPSQLAGTQALDPSRADL